MTVTGPGVPVKVEAFQTRHIGDHLLREGAQKVLRQVQVLDERRLKYLEVAHGDERVRMELREPISFQVHQPERGEPVENLWVYKLNVVVVHVQPGQAPEATESILLKFSNFIIAHLQDLRVKRAPLFGRRSCHKREKYIHKPCVVIHTRHCVSLV